MAYAQIDWHDFVVVETVDYQPNESGMFPTPTTPDEVGARVLMQERMDQETEATETASRAEKKAAERQEINDVEMELSDKEDDPEVCQKLYVMTCYCSLTYVMNGSF